jgi:cytochrome c peroxidase
MIKTVLNKMILALATASLFVAVVPSVLMATGDPDVDAPLGALPAPPIPADNKQTPAKIELGKKLFFDTRLGGDLSTPCSVCHEPAQGWSFADSISRGYPGTVHWRSSQTIINSAYYGKLFWAGSSKSLEGQARSAARGGVAGNGEADVMEARLALIPEYRQAFKQVFGDELPLIRNAWRAIASFERTLVQRDTPFDRYMNGDQTALTEQQKRGLKLFRGKANCAECHNGALFSDGKYYNTAVPTQERWQEDGLAQITFRFEMYAKGSTEKMYRKLKRDPGHYFRGKDKRHKGLFRTPSLRYTAYTAPYMHNGSIDTLEEVIDFYNAGGGKDAWGTKTGILKPLKLSEKEKSDLLAFVESLSGKEILMNKPKLPKMVSLSEIPVK